MPSRKLINATIGSASTPAFSAMRQTSRQRTVRGWVNAWKSAAVVSPMNETWIRRSRQTCEAALPISSITGARGGSGSRSRSSRLASNCRSIASYGARRLATSTAGSRGCRRSSTKSAAPAPSR